ncbi:MAG TPA: hypothetical protein VMU16_05640 [Candidatus Binataceae bacterium]|nr:hypothetical protein [Candidatus Binataceae bacterium]
MPRKKATRRSGSAFAQVQRQARAILATLRKDIRIQEMELSRYKDQAAKLVSLVMGRVSAAAGARGRTAGGRINWRTVLSQVPKQFHASDVRNVRGLKGKRPSEIFAAITRWIDAGLVKRKSRGVYEKV